MSLAGEIVIPQDSPFQTIFKTDLTSQNQKKNGQDMAVRKIMKFLLYHKHCWVKKQICKGNAILKKTKT